MEKSFQRNTNNPNPENFSLMDYKIREDPTLLSYPHGLNVNFGRLRGKYPNATDVKAIPPEVSGLGNNPSQKLALKARERIEAIYNMNPPTYQ